MNFTSSKKFYLHCLPNVELKTHTKGFEKSVPQHALEKLYVTTILSSYFSIDHEMAPKKCCGILFVHWFSQVNQSITTSKENVVVSFHNPLCFKMINKANFKLDFKIKETLDINRTKPKLIVQQNCLTLIFSLQLVSPLCSFLPLFFLLFSFIIFIISDTNYQHFHCLNQTLLLLHLITNNVISHFSP